jgi:D-3-phosphoglycerate dehydrogenase / 2-oxoglutarate reductase
MKEANTMRVLLTCPPMLGMQSSFRPLFAAKGIELYCPNVAQTLSEAELIALLPGFDGWIIGDDPATRRVFEAGKQGRLKAAVKWGIGVDNVDFDAARDFGIPIANTPLMFGREVADVAMSYVVALARQTFLIDRAIRAGGWPKPRGISLSGKTMALAGFGDIGRNVAKRALAADMKIVAYDVAFKPDAALPTVKNAVWPQRVEEADYIVLACSLNPANHHMLGAPELARAKTGVRVVNVARGPLIDESALIAALQSGQVHSVALDVFEQEPLPATSPLRSMERCIFGSHNGSNTEDAVVRASEKATQLLFGFLGV